MQEQSEQYAEHILRIMEISDWSDVHNKEYELERQYDAGTATDSSDDVQLDMRRRETCSSIQEKESDFDRGVNERHINDKELLAYLLCVDLIMKGCVGAQGRTKVAIVCRVEFMFRVR